MVILRESWLSKCSDLGVVFTRLMELAQLNLKRVHSNYLGELPFEIVRRRYCCGCLYRWAAAAFTRLLSPLSSPTIVPTSLPFAPATGGVCLLGPGFVCLCSAVFRDRMLSLGAPTATDI